MFNIFVIDVASTETILLFVKIKVSRVLLLIEIHQFLHAEFYYDLNLVGSENYCNSMIQIFFGTI